MAGYPSVFAHGMLSMGLTGHMLTDWLGAGSLKKYGVRFTKQVWPGDTLTAKGEVTKVEDGLATIKVVTVNQNGESRGRRGGGGGRLAVHLSPFVSVELR